MGSTPRFPRRWFWVVAALFGLLLAFVIIIAYENFLEASAGVSPEADSLASIVRDSAAFPEPEGDRVRGAVRTYLRAVVDDEWARMRDGSDSPRATTMTQTSDAHRGPRRRNDRHSSYGVLPQLGRLADRIGLVATAPVGFALGAALVVEGAGAGTGCEGGEGHRLRA